MSKQTFGMIVVALGCFMAVSAFSASMTDTGIDGGKVAAYLVLPTVVVVVGAWMWFSRPKQR